MLSQTKSNKYLLNIICILDLEKNNDHKKQQPKE
jgi:hypothetical protein